MGFEWLEVVIASLLITLVGGTILARGRSWLEPAFWKRFAIVGSIVMFVFLWILTFDTLNQTSVGTERVPDFTVINKKIGYKFDPDKGYFKPTIQGEEPLFGKVYSKEEAKELMVKGKLVIQSRNCMDCHTLLGNGAYYAPDLTKAWLDPKWEKVMVPATGSKTKEEAMVKFLMHPDKYATWIRRMPNLHISEEEAKAVVAYLKWMSAINTNGFPDHFGSSKLVKLD